MSVAFSIYKNTSAMATYPNSRRRTNSRKKSPKISLKHIVVFILLCLLVILIYNWYVGRKNSQTSQVATIEETTTNSATSVDAPTEKTAPEPTGKKYKETSHKNVSKTINMPSVVGDNQIVRHKYFTLSYNDVHEQADWVFYLLTRAMTQNQSSRTNDFRADPDVKLISAYTEDYTGTGYDRGHLCPSADVRIDKVGQSETFYMSNMSPQTKEFNRGIWKKLEEQVRKWVGKHDSIYIATGPVLEKGLKKIGRRTKVSVPNKYYKILYTPADGGHIIGFLLPNDACKGHTFKDYQVTIDEIEQVTGIDFFPKIDNEELLESEKASLKWWN